MKLLLMPLVGLWGSRNYIRFHTQLTIQLNQTKNMTLKLEYLLTKHGNACCYCGCEMNRISRHPKSATIEHLKDKWESPKNQKINTEENCSVACYGCNNKRGSVRNKIARRYYQECAAKQGIKIAAASVESAKLFAMFGSVPPQKFKDCWNPC